MIEHLIQNLESLHFKISSGLVIEEMGDKINGPTACELFLAYFSH